ncbi:MAG: glycosyltransferase family 2 protein [Planctomycetota bacterium]
MVDCDWSSHRPAPVPSEHCEQSGSNVIIALTHALCLSACIHDQLQAHQSPGEDHRSMRVLIAIPVFNEQQYVANVLTRVREYASDVLVIDDGSTDYTPVLLAMQPVEVIRHAENRGYGRSLQDAFRWAQVDCFDWLITMDCDEQHEPASIPDFLAAAERDDADIISGSRYHACSQKSDQPPSDRRAINRIITHELNARLSLDLTDGFCGFKAYRVDALRRLNLDIDGYDFPMQFWVQAVANGLRITELPIRLIYNDPSRTFGGPLNITRQRLHHYRHTMYREILTHRDRLPSPRATAGIDAELVASVSATPGADDEGRCSLAHSAPGVLSDHVARIEEHLVGVCDSNTCPADSNETPGVSAAASNGGMAVSECEIKSGGTA